MQRFFPLLFIAGCAGPAGPAPSPEGPGGPAVATPDAAQAPTEPDYRRGPQAARATSLGHLCEDPESVVFTCTLQGGVGMVSVCGTRAEEGDWELTARYASQDSPVIAALAPLRYGRDEGATVNHSALAFAVDGTTYEIQATYEHDTSCYQLLMVAPDQTDQTLPCTGPVFDQVGGLAGRGLTVEPIWR